MINEVMAKAITGIDENLISDAENVQRKHSIIRPVFSLCAVAACLVLVFTFIFSSGNNRNAPALFLNESEITSDPVVIDVPMAAMLRDADSSITVDLFLDIKEATSIRISGGTMNVCSAGNTDTLYYTGTEYTSEIPVNVHWTVDGSDIKSAYTLTLNDSEIVYDLIYDASASLWSICKQ